MARLNHIKSFRGTTKTEDGNLTCESCRDKIKPGDGYRWWANRAPGQRGGFRRIRCMKADCTPSIADRTPGRRGQWYGMQEAFEKELAECGTVEDVQSAAESIAEQVREFAGEFTESADNMESGFGHETEQSAELRERGENIENAADEIEQVDLSDLEADDDGFDEDEAKKEALVEAEDPDDEAEVLHLMQEKRDEYDAEHEGEDSDEERVGQARERVQEAIDMVDVG